MNISFKQLSLKAGLASCSLPNAGERMLVAINPETGLQIDPNIALNLFADLLLIECIKTIEVAAAKSPAVSFDEHGRNPYRVCIEEIRKNFGMNRSVIS